MRRSQADSTNRSLAAFGKLQHIPPRSTAHTQLMKGLDGYVTPAN